MMTFQKLPGLFEFILIGVIGFFYFWYIARISYAAIILRTSFRSVFKKLILRSIYFSLIILSLLAPSFGDVKKEIKSIGKDIYFLVDLSNSMNVRDIEPSRLDKVKFELKKITESFSSDRIGLIIFSSEAFVQCPLTFDLGALSVFIETLNTNLVPSAGTDFAPAIDMALKRFKNADLNDGNEPKSKILILISDGEDFGEDTEDLVEKLDDDNIKLFALGIGTETGGRVPSENGFKRDENGEIATSKLNATALKKLANITGAKYYEITDQKNEVPKLISDISNIEGELREIKTVDTSANKYFYFLFVALILIVLDILITVKVIKL